MDSPKTILPAVVIGQLYRHSLVAIDDEQIPPSSPSAEITEPALPAGADEVMTGNAGPVVAPLRFLGNNARRIAILVNYPGEPFLPEASLQFLTNILNACKLNIGDTAIVNAGRDAVDFPLLRTTLHMEQLILFGNIPGIIPGAASFAIEVVEGVGALTAPALEEMNNGSAEGKQLKGRLWQALKQLFNL